jgi:dolichyl-phosphate beta-glucosyltransferase
MNNRNPTDGSQFLLVIPCYCESNRLSRFLHPLINKLSDAPFRTDILVVDDGSPLQEYRRLRETVQVGQIGAVTVLPPERLTENTGKGGAILHGWRQSSAYLWRAFVDADGAVPSEEVLRVLRRVHVEGNLRQSYFATRSPQRGRTVQRTLVRGLAGQIFTGLARTIVGSELTDSQCGFKIISNQAFAQIDRKMEGYGFCFDLELYAMLSRIGAPIQEVPIDWKDQPGGHISLLHHSPQMILDLLRIRQATRTFSRQYTTTLAPARSL